MKKRVIAAGLLLASLGTPTLAQDCKPLTLIQSVKMTTLAGENRRIVPVSVDSTPLNFLLDTGGSITALTKSAAQKANLHVQKSNDSVRIYGVDGSQSQQSAAIDELMVGRMRWAKTRAFILPGENGFDGLLSAPTLFNYDIDLDFSENTMKYFLSDHCPGKILYWKADAVGMVPILLRDKAHVEVEVVLDGKTFDAIIDTGATDTVVSDTVAKFFLGVSDPGPNDAVVDATPASYRYVHVFSSLSFGDITIKNPRIHVYHDTFRDKDRTQQTGNRALRDSDNVKRPTMIIGMNILQHLHVYMAFGEKRLYVTPAAAAPVPASETPPKP